MIDIRKLKELVRLMVANDLTEIDLRDSEEQVTLHRPSPNASPQVVQAAAPQPTAAPAPVVAQPASRRPRLRPNRPRQSRMTPPASCRFPARWSARSIRPRPPMPIHSSP